MPAHYPGKRLLDVVGATVGLVVTMPLQRMGPRLCVLLVALVVTVGCASEPEPERDIVGICQPAVELRLPTGDVEFEVSTFEYFDFKDGSQQVTGAVDAVDGAYFFECKTNALMVERMPFK
jgi:hypothetical protein